MPKHARIKGTRTRTDATPACKQCLEARVISSITGKPIGSNQDGRDHMVKIMGAWACKLHFKIQNKRRHGLEGGFDKDWSLVDIFPNRRARRSAGRTRGLA